MKAFFKLLLFLMVVTALLLSIIALVGRGTHPGTSPDASDSDAVTEKEKENEGSIPSIDDEGGVTVTDKILPAGVLKNAEGIACITEAASLLTHNTFTTEITETGVYGITVKYAEEYDRDFISLTVDDETVSAGARAYGNAGEDGYSEQILYRFIEKGTHDMTFSLFCDGGTPADHEVTSIRISKVADADLLLPNTEMTYTKNCESAASQGEFRGGYMLRSDDSAEAYDTVSFAYTAKKAGAHTFGILMAAGTCKSVDVQITSDDGKEYETQTLLLADILPTYSVTSYGEVFVDAFEIDCVEGKTYTFTMQTTPGTGSGWIHLTGVTVDTEG